ncbi:hypothetical protein R1flu_020242 [Riccia fluitans]|uniref:Uncharacterized protein n=1 Tax=Riccia fluitans TaxID=41844 RepID=A0ABD1ZPS7_9MARC
MNESDQILHDNGRKGDEDREYVAAEAAERVAALLERCKVLQDMAATHVARVKYDSQALSQQVTSVVADIKSVRAFINSAHDHINPRVSEKLEVDLFRARSMIYEGDAASLLPAKPNGYFLTTFLGPVNVRGPRNDVRLKVKEEYNSYRDRTALLFWLQLYQAWLLFFYTSLALRENILRVNGSDIRPWWVYHHYCAMVMALISLTWGLQGHPSCIRKQQGNCSRKGRKDGRSLGETSGVKGQIWVLYPLLFILQIFQFSIGALLLRTSIMEDEAEWQMVACGLLLLIMANGNFELLDIAKQLKDLATYPAGV